MLGSIRKAVEELIAQYEDRCEEYAQALVLTMSSPVYIDLSSRRGELEVCISDLTLFKIKVDETEQEFLKECLNENKDKQLLIAKDEIRLLKEKIVLLEEEISQYKKLKQKKTKK